MRLVKDGNVVVPGAGTAAGHLDEAYEKAGASIVEGEGLSGDVVAMASPEEIVRLGGERVLISHLQPLTNVDGVKALAAVGLTSFAMESRSTPNSPPAHPS